MVIAMVRTVKWVAYVTFALAFAAGIIYAYAYAPEPEYSFDSKKPDFMIMISFWIAGGISSIFILAFARMIELLEIIAERSSPDKHDVSESKLSKLSGLKL